MAALRQEGQRRLLEDARHALPQPAGARSRRPREVRQGGRASTTATSRTRSTTHKYDAQIDADSAEGTKFGARGTPAFFINGRSLSGAQPFDPSRRSSTRRSPTPPSALHNGAKLANVYAAMTRTASRPPRRPRAPQQPQPAQADPNAVYKVPLGNSPEKGPKTAKVTIVQFSDFQCPFCSRVEPTITDLEKDYGKELRVVWKNNPLPFHQNAMPAAKAAMAAAAQGKFWEMHDKLFADQAHLDPATYEKYAQRDRPEHVEVQGRDERPQDRGGDQGRPGAGRALRRAGHAGLLHQRPSAPRRAAEGAVQGDHRQGDHRRPTRRSRRAPSRPTSTPSSPRTARTRPRGRARAAGRRVRVSPIRTRSIARSSRTRRSRAPTPATPRSPSSSGRTSSARSAGASSRRSSRS